jgi:hypothetical protein
MNGPSVERESKGFWSDLLIYSAQCLLLFLSRLKGLNDLISYQNCIVHQRKHKLTLFSLFYDQFNWRLTFLNLALVLCNISVRTLSKFAYWSTIVGAVIMALSLGFGLFAGFWRSGRSGSWYSFRFCFLTVLRGGEVSLSPRCLLGSEAVGEGFVLSVGMGAADAHVASSRTGSSIPCEFKRSWERLSWNVYPFRKTGVRPKSMRWKVASIGACLFCYWKKDLLLIRWSRSVCANFYFSHRLI